MRINWRKDHPLLFDNQISNIIRLKNAEEDEEECRLLEIALDATIESLYERKKGKKLRYDLL